MSEDHLMPHEQRRLDRLRQHGISPAGPWTAGETRRFREHLAKAPVRDGHVWAKGKSPPTYDRPSGWPMFCHRMEDVVAAPYLLETAIALLPLAKAYFDGERPLIYSLNAFWTQPAPGAEPYLDTHAWHRDGDDRKQLVLFVFGTDVAHRDDGAHLYQRGSHLLGDGELGRDFRAPPEGEVEVVTGLAGLAFMADTGGLHMGLRPKTRPRLLAWARFGVSDPPNSYVWDQLSPVPKEVLGSRYPADSEYQEAIRLVVR